jgi:hypothetical protein
MAVADVLSAASREVVRVSMRQHTMPPARL